MVMELRESFVCEKQFNPVPHVNAGRFIVSGTFQKADTRNANGRVYRRSLWEKILSRPDIQDSLKKRKMLGELGHPDTVETTPINISHIVTELKLLPNGDIYGEAEILDTPSGRILKTLYDAEVEMGISSRGYLPEGSNLYPEGRDLIVPDDFELITFDFVIEPSTPGANPTVKEGLKRQLTSILAESKDKVNKEVVSFIENLDSKSLVEPSSKGLKVLRESAPTKNLSTKTDKEVAQFMENQAYIDKLHSIVSDLKDRYMVAESIIDDLMNERLTANDILKDISKRYLTAEAIIKDFREYTLKLEETLTEVTALQQVSEGVIQELCGRYTLSEGIIDDLKNRYTLSEQQVVALKDIIASQPEVSGQSSVSEEIISNLKKRVQISEEVISGLAEKVNQKETPKAKKPVPNGYFEGFAEKYKISIVEAKTLFKSVGCNKKAFEFHLEERQKLTRKPYGEFPYMKESTTSQSVYSTSDKVDDETEKLARIISKSF